MDEIGRRLSALAHRERETVLTPTVEDVVRRGRRRRLFRRAAAGGSAAAVVAVGAGLGLTLPGGGAPATVQIAPAAGSATTASTAPVPAEVRQIAQGHENCAFWSPTKVTWVRTTYQLVYDVGGFGQGRVKVTEPGGQVNWIGHGKPPAPSTPYYVVQLVGKLACSPNAGGARMMARHDSVVTIFQPVGAGRHAAASLHTRAARSDGSATDLGAYGTVHTYTP
jgi:hypothetical protein